MTKVLSVTAECVPLVKTGGLADVAGALPGALAGHGVDMRTLLPGYRAVVAQLATREVVAQWDDLFGGFARVLKGALTAMPPPPPVTDAEIKALLTYVKSLHQPAKKKN